MRRYDPKLDRDPFLYALVAVALIVTVFWISAAIVGINSIANRVQ